MNPSYMISVLVPVYNNEDTLKELVQRIRAELADYVFEIVFVEDGSLDASSRILRELAESDVSIKVIRFTRNFGQHPAISACLQAAQGEILVLMDADLQDRPEDIKSLLAAMGSENEIVYTRKIEIEPATARFTSMMFHFVFSRIVGTPVPINIGTFRAFNRRVRDALLRFPERNVLYGPLMFFIGFRAVFIDVIHQRRQTGRSSYSIWRRLGMAFGALISYTDIPHRIALILGVSTLITTMVYTLVILIQYVVFEHSLPPGLNLILLVVLALFGTVMTSLGIIGAYVFRVYQEVLRRPRFLVAETYNTDFEFN